MEIITIKFNDGQERDLAMGGAGTLYYCGEKVGVCDPANPERISRGEITAWGAFEVVARRICDKTCDACGSDCKPR